MRTESSSPGRVMVRSAHRHNYRLSAYERKENDFYPTPSDLAIGLALGLPRLGLDLPRVALDPCGGDGALRRCLKPFGVNVRLSDLYPEMYATADGYLTREPLDASDPKHLRHAFGLAGAGCTAIITNTPHNTKEACAIVENSDRACGRGATASILSRRCSGRSGAPSPGGCPISTGRPSTAKFFAVGVLGGSQGSEGSPMHAYAWYVWRKTPRSGPSLKVRIGKAEAKRPIDFASGRGASRRQRGPIQEMLTNSP